MKLADLPPDTRSDLARRRRYPLTGEVRHPADGEVWFDDYETCAVCSAAKGAMWDDHCHVTGLVRGRLCPGCNGEEGRRDGPVWELWRLTAPELAMDRREISWRADANYRFVTNEEALTLPMPELFQLHDERREAGHARLAPIYAKVIGDALAPLFAPEAGAA